MLGRKHVVRLSRIDSIVGDAILTKDTQQVCAPATKNVAASATNLHGTKQRVLPVSSKNDGSKGNDESSFSSMCDQ